MKEYLLCTDLDRTLIPNGHQEESPGAREFFAAVIARQEHCLAYVSGRHRALIEEGIRQYGLPLPDFAIADVGATIHVVGPDGWRRLEAWEGHLETDWRGRAGADIFGLLRDIPGLRRQEEEKQGRHKLSFYVSLDADTEELSKRVRRVLAGERLRSNLVWSIDEPKGVGLLDVLPARAGKLNAIRFLMAQRAYTRENTVFAGDSGNDLDVFLSGIPSVMVANTNPDIKAMAARMKGTRLYAARGDFLGMNGNYAAGVLEGMAHFWPRTAALLREMQTKESPCTNRHPTPCCTKSSQN